MIGVILENKSKYADYIFKTLFGIMGFEYSFTSEKDAKKYPVVVYYGNKTNLKLNFVIRIPYSKVYLDKIKGKSYSKSKNGANFNLDVISLSFYLLSRQEELDNKKRDMHKRFDHTYTILKDFIKKPLINDHIKQLEGLIIDGFKKQKKPLLKKAYWPDAEDFSASLTHDVDVLYKYNLIGVLKDIKKSLIFFLKLKFVSSLSSIYDLFKSLIFNKEPYFQLQNLAELEQRYGYRSTFYFCAKKRHKLDPDYSINSPRIRNSIKELSDNGFEIGVHGTYTSYSSLKKLDEEKVLLENISGKKVIGVRQHFGRFEVPYTWRLQNKIFAYDSTLGYINISGFRPSVCFPFKAFDALENKEFDLVEIPFNTSDGTLFGPMQLGKEEAWKDTKNLIDTVRKNNGLVVLDWHQRTIYEKDFPGFGWVYTKALDYLKKLNAYVAPLSEIVEYWKARDGLSVRFDRKNKTYIISSKKSVDSSFIIYNTKKLNIKGNKNHKIIKKKNYSLIKFKDLKKVEIKIS